MTAATREQKLKPFAVCANYGCGLPAVKTVSAGSKKKRNLCAGCYVKIMDNRKRERERKTKC